jgi:dipeptidyl aminopeptidase/acylaminoacyl peptidase
VIRAKNFLASQPEIDKQHIGLTGISWGGVITSTVMGFDNSFDFSIPIYGCGFLDGMQNQYQKALVGNPAYQDIWEPGHRMSTYLNPSLWLTWREDKHFALDAQEKSYKQLTGDYSVSIKPGIKHGHNAGWAQPESYFFAKQIVLQDDVWAKSLTVNKLNSGKAQAQFLFNLDNKEYQVKKATIHYTKDKGHTGEAKWVQSDAEVVVSETVPGRYIATSEVLSMGVRHWFVNLEVQIIEEDKTYTVSSSLFSN